MPVARKISVSEGLSGGDLPLGAIEVVVHLLHVPVEGNRVVIGLHISLILLNYSHTYILY